MANPLNAYLQAKIRELDYTFYCPAVAGLKSYIERCALLNAAGHDTTKLQAAIDHANLSIESLKRVSTQATEKFLQEGAYVVTDKAKIEVLEADKLT
jgi:hypothetical protein